jgi:DAK2 domain fusion protein YloV
LKVVSETLPLVTEEKWLTCNGQQLAKMARAGLLVLDHNHKKVNDLNVFPVPDGDTGTNMLLTMRAACERIAGNQDERVGIIAHELSHGALMGARGNSGVILSQIWRGMAKRLKDKNTFDVNDLAVAMREASDTAYKGVMRPVEGTILTVIREGAEEAEDAVNKSDDLRFILARIVERSEQALARTPDMLPILKQADVIDAGGQGLVCIMQGMLQYVLGDLAESIDTAHTVVVPAQAKAAPAGGLENPYDVQFILMGENLDVFKIRSVIDSMGDSTLVVGDESTIKVHVHVKDPGMPISFGIEHGKITDVVIENMQLQMEEIIAPTQGSLMAFEESNSAVESDHIGVVAVAAGDGLAKIFESLGVTGIVNGGQSNNPSTEEILKTVQEVPTNDVIILPNNKNILLAAQAARDLSTKNVVVVPTRTVPQGISAILSVNRRAVLEDAVADMQVASEQVASGEIAVATRAADLDGVKVQEGEIIGVVDGRLCVAATDLDEVLEKLLEEMDASNHELITVYYGQDVSQQEAAQMASQIGMIYPDLEVELLDGGQPIYQYILGAE